MNTFRYLRDHAGQNVLLLEYADNLHWTLHAAQVASATKVNKWRRWLWRRSQESGAMSNYTYSGQNDQQSGNYRHWWNSCAIPKKKSGRAIWWSHGLCDGDFTETAKDLHRQEYVAASDTVVACIQDRSDKLDIPCFVHYYLESLLIRHVRRGITDYEDLDAHCHLWQQMERWISFTWMSTFCYSSSGSDCIMSQVNGRTSAVYSRHSCSECCIGEIVEWATTSQKHHDAAGTYVWTISGHEAVLTEFIGESKHRCGLFAAYIWEQYHWRRLFVTVMWGSYDIKVYYWIYWWQFDLDPSTHFNIYPWFFDKNYFAKPFKEKSSSIDSTRWSNSTLRNIVVSHRRPVNNCFF